MASNYEIRKNEDGSIDEVVAENCQFHLEQMDDDHWWMAISVDNKRIHIYLATLHGAHIRASVEIENA